LGPDGSGKVRVRSVGRTIVAGSSKIDFKAMQEKAGRFPPEAFQFVREGLAHTVQMVHGQDAIAHAPSEDENRHVSGQQLCLGLKDYAVRQYGLLARTVLTRWGVSRTEDFGRIVFAMIDAGLMRRTEDDSLEDFQQVYDFDEAFESLRDGSRN
jgi:uncharacterized repeat protein (TIGR04138 family)